MNRTKWITGSLMALALLTGGAASAQMGPQQNYPQDQGGLSDDPGPPADEMPARQDQANRPRADDDFSDVAAANQGRAGSERYGRPDDQAPASAGQKGDDMTTSCALSARDEAEGDGGYAEVRQMQEPRETRNGYDVEGDVEVRSGWRAQDGTLRHFTCSVQNGRVTDVYFRRDRTAR